MGVKIFNVIRDLGAPVGLNTRAPIFSGATPTGALGMRS